MQWVTTPFPCTPLLSLTPTEGQNGTKMLTLPVSSEELLLGCPELSPWPSLASGYKWKHSSGSQVCWLLGGFSWLSCFRIVTGTATILESSLMIVGLLEILSFLHTSQLLMTFYMDILLAWPLWRLIRGWRETVKNTDYTEVVGIGLSHTILVSRPVQKWSSY